MNEATQETDHFLPNPTRPPDIKSVSSRRHPHTSVFEEGPIVDENNTIALSCFTRHLRRVRQGDYQLILAIESVDNTNRITCPIAILTVATSTPPFSITRLILYRPGKQSPRCKDSEPGLLKRQLPCTNERLCQVSAMAFNTFQAVQSM